MDQVLLFLNMTEDPSVPYTRQDYIRVLNVFEIKKTLREEHKTKRNIGNHKNNNNPRNPTKGTLRIP